MNDVPGLLEKIWALVSVAISGLISYFIYGVRTNANDVKKLSERHGRTREMAVETKTYVKEIKEDVQRLERSVSKLTDAIEILIKKQTRR